MTPPLHKIQSLEEFMTFLPMLVAFHRDKPGIWQPDVDSAEFLAMLLEQFGQVDYFGAKNETELEYFLAVKPLAGTKTVNFWLCFVNHHMKEHTSNYIEQLRQLYKGAGFTRATFTTSRMTRSYDRFVTKFGAEKYSLTYQIIL